jgi:cytoskeletal protein RodZ
MRKGSLSRQRKSSAFDKSSQRRSVFQQPILREGYLEKQSSGRIQKWQSRYFELSGHYLKYYENKETKSDETLKGAVDLSSVNTVTSQAVSITIVTKDGMEINLRSTSDQVAKLWVAEIQQVVHIAAVVVNAPVLNATKSETKEPKNVQNVPQSPRPSYGEIQGSKETLRVMSFNILANCWVNYGGDEGKDYYTFESKPIDLLLLKLKSRLPLIVKQVRCYIRNRYKR